MGLKAEFPEDEPATLVVLVGVFSLATFICFQVM